MLISNAYAQAAPAPNIPSGMMDIALPIIMVVAVYFLMFRPQMKKHKEHQKLVSDLQKGDEVIVAGGITGRISQDRRQLHHGRDRQGRGNPGPETRSIHRAAQGHPQAPLSRTRRPPGNHPPACFSLHYA